MPQRRCGVCRQNGAYHDTVPGRGAARIVIARGLRRAAGVHLGLLRVHAPRPDRCAPVSSVPLPVAPVVIAVVTAVRNQRAFVERATHSVLSQGYPELEYVVKDGASTDGTLEWLEANAAGRYRLLTGTDAGPGAALNQAFAATRGQIMTFLNGDDILRPGAIVFAADFFARHPDVDVVYGHRLIIDANNREVGRWWLPPHDESVLRHRDFIPQEGAFWRRRIWDRVGGIDSSFQFAFDWDLFLRFGEAGARFVRVPEFLAAFRTHREQKTWTQADTVGRAEVERLLQRVHGRVPSAWRRNLAVSGYVAASAALTWRHRLRGG
jgi:glycosyltransferase involved in cell wall biosynthesis